MLLQNVYALFWEHMNCISSMVRQECLILRENIISRYKRLKISIFRILW